MRITMEGIGLYVGIDPSLTQPGLSVVDAKGVALLATSLSVGRNLRGAKRLEQISRWVCREIAAFEGEILRVCMEGPSLGSTHREFDLGEASGAIKSFLFAAEGVEPEIIEPTRLKLFATGNGQSPKSEVLHAVKNVAGLDLGNNDDAADAYMLARLAWALDHLELLKRRCEMEVVRAVLSPKKSQRRIRSDNKTNI